MEELFRVIVLGIVQGLTEFLPISSSGHLVLVRDLFGWEFDNELTLDVALHVGTTAAVLGYFWREWWSMAADGLRWAQRKPASATTGFYDRRLLWLLVLGSIPAGVAGLALEGPIEHYVRSPEVIGVMLIVFGLGLYVIDRTARVSRDLQGATALDSLLIGAAQAVALVPGVSRSGITISTGLLRDFKRDDAARFSFLLSTPVIAGAALLQAAKAAGTGISASEAGIMLAGAAAAAITGWLAIRFLLQFTRRGTYIPFVVYRLVAGLFVIVYFAFN